MERFNLSVKYYVYLVGTVMLFKKSVSFELLENKINFLLQSSAIALISKHVSNYAHVP